MNSLSLGGILLAGLLGITPVRVLQIGTGPTSTCALLEDGAVKCWGRNSAVASARGLESSKVPAAEIPALVPRINLGTDASGAYRPAVALASSWFHACAIMADDRSVKCWGAFNEGVGTFSIARPRDMGNSLQPVRLAPGDRARSIAVSTYSSCAVLEDDTLKCWGRNFMGQLGQGDVTNRPSYERIRPDIAPINLGENVKVKKVAVAENSTCALIDQGKEEGLVKCWGQNNDGNLGTGDNVSRGSAPAEMGDALPKVDFGNGRHAIDIQSGYYHTCALLDDRSIMCWGRHGYGELGTGSIRGQGSAGTFPLRAVNLGRGGIEAIRMSIGGHNSCAILSNQTVKCWGRGTAGELGQLTLGNRGQRAEDMGDALRPINLGRGYAVESVSMADQHVCALLVGGRVKCWGANGVAQLGLGDTMIRNSPQQMGDALPFVDFGTTLNQETN